MVTYVAAAHGLVKFTLHTFIRLENHGSVSFVIRNAFVRLEAGDRELERRSVSQNGLKIGQRLEAYSATEVMELSVELSVNEYLVQQYADGKVERCSVRLVIEASESVARLIFPLKEQETG